MQRRDSARAKLSPVRAIAVVIAAGMGLAAVCLVVFATTQKQLQIGVLLGLWGGLIAAFLVFGARRGQSEQSERLAEAELRVSQLHEAQLQVSQLQREQLNAARQGPSQELQLHRQGEVELSREVAARREADLNLELSLRREIERMMTDHIGALRDEVASLRAEVVDKLGGQLRLERIETTRLIGSDLEALQHEIRRLASSQPDRSASQVRVSGPLPQLPRESASAGADNPASTPPWRVDHRSDIVDAEVIEAEHVTAHDEVNSPVKPFQDAKPAQPGSTAESDSNGWAPPPAPRWQPPAATEAPSWQPATEPPSSSDPRSGQPAAADRPAAQPSTDSRGWQLSDWLPPAVPVEPSAPPTTPTTPPVPAGWSAPTVVNGDPLTDPARPIAQAEGDSALPLYRQSEQVAAFTSNFDPFAGLPRLSPLPEDIDLIQDPEPEPVPPPDQPDQPSGNAKDAGDAGDLRPEAGRRRAPEDADPQRYHGRRRAGAEDAEPNGHDRAPQPPAAAPPAAAPSSAAPSSAAQSEVGEPGQPAERGSGRRRAPDDVPDDLLARLPKY